MEELKNLTAVEDKVIVEEINPTQTEGGIIIPEGVKQLPQAYGKVLSAGPSVEGIKAGDMIMCHPNGGQVIIHEKKICRVLQVNEVYGIVS